MSTHIREKTAQFARFADAIADSLQNRPTCAKFPRHRGARLSKIDPAFMRRVQQAGWIIIGADEFTVWGSCPRDGCSLKVKLKPDATLPQTCGRGPDLAEIVVNTFDDARIPLRDRRDDLGLIIKDVEEAAGMAVDYLSKFEKDNPSKIPNAQTFFEWAQALGYQVVLRPAPLPPYTMRLISDSRDKLDLRRRHLRIHADRRRSKA